MKPGTGSASGSSEVSHLRRNSFPCSALHVYDERLFSDLLQDVFGRVVFEPGFRDFAVMKRLLSPLLCIRHDSFDHLYWRLIWFDLVIQRSVRVHLKTLLTPVCIILFFGNAHHQEEHMQSLFPHPGR